MQQNLVVQDKLNFKINNSSGCADLVVQKKSSKYLNTYFIHYRLVWYTLPTINKCSARGLRRFLEGRSDLYLPLFQTLAEGLKFLFAELIFEILT